LMIEPNSGIDGASEAGRKIVCRHVEPGGPN
jgi:hypothetical protein